VIGVVLVGVGDGVVIEEGELAQDVSNTKQKSVETKMAPMRLANMYNPSSKSNQGDSRVYGLKWQSQHALL
jgi:hypothetical protein